MAEGQCGPQETEVAVAVGCTGRDVSWVGDVGLELDAREAGHGAGQWLHAIIVGRGVLLAWHAADTALGARRTRRDAEAAARVAKTRAGGSLRPRVPGSLRVMVTMCHLTRILRPDHFHSEFGAQLLQHTC